MIYEMRTYTTHPGRLSRWLAAFEEDRLPLLHKHLEHLVGAFTPETGMLNQLVHIWAYRDHDDRARRRMALWADPQWLNPVLNTTDDLQSMESRIMLPTRFSPLR